jgi:hypothetical protein
MKALKEMSSLLILLGIIVIFSCGSAGFIVSPFLYSLFYQEDLLGSKYFNIVVFGGPVLFAVLGLAGVGVIGIIAIRKYSVKEPKSIPNSSGDKTDS